MSDTNSKTPGRHEYMTLETERRDGDNVVKLRVSRRHPDKRCDCEEPGYAGEDIHDDIRMTFKVNFVRIADRAGMLEAAPALKLVAAPAAEKENDDENE